MLKTVICHCEHIVSDNVHRDGCVACLKHRRARIDVILKNTITLIKNRFHFYIALAKAIGVAPSRITDIVNGHRGITADTDLRLSRLFSLSEGYFLRLQDHIETTLTRQKISTELTRIIPLAKKTA